MHTYTCSRRRDHACAGHLLLRSAQRKSHAIEQRVIPQTCAQPNMRGLLTKGEQMSRRFMEDSTEESDVSMGSISFSPSDSKSLVSPAAFPCIIVLCPEKKHVCQRQMPSSMLSCDVVCLRNSFKPNCLHCSTDIRRCWTARPSLQVAVVSWVEVQRASAQEEEKRRAANSHP